MAKSSLCPFNLLRENNENKDDMHIVRYVSAILEDQKEVSINKYYSMLAGPAEDFFESQRKYISHIHPIQLSDFIEFLGNYAQIYNIVKIQMYTDDFEEIIIELNENKDYDNMMRKKMYDFIKK